MNKTKTDMKKGMKKTLFSIIIAFMVSTMASAQVFTVEGITYKITNSVGKYEVLVEKGPCVESVKIPAEVTYSENNVTYSVEAIGYEAFQDCKELTSVTIAEGVKRIAGAAFDGCTNLTSVNLPSSMTSIGNLAFSNCEKLAGIIIPGSVTTIGAGAFQNCTELASIVIPCSMTSIGELSFQNCTELDSITFGNGMMDIADDAFENCSNVKSVTFLGVMSLGKIFSGFGTAESPVALKLPSFWPANDKPVNSSTSWHEGYFSCEYVDPVKEFLGELGNEQDGPVVEVIKGDMTIKLYNPEKVNFIKVTK